MAYPKQMAAKVADALNKENLRHKIVTRDLQDNFDRKRQQVRVFERKWVRARQRIRSCLPRSCIYVRKANDP